MFKQTIVMPFFQKTYTWQRHLQNYRLVSNLNFLSKVTEKAVASKIKLRIWQFDLDNSFQLS